MEMTCRNALPVVVAVGIGPYCPIACEPIAEVLRPEGGGLGGRCWSTALLARRSASLFAVSG